MTLTTVAPGVGGTGLTAPGTNGNVLTSNGTAWVSQAPAAGGKVLQVVSTTKTDTFSSSIEDAWTDITGMSVSITPTSSSSRILVMVMVTYNTTNNYIRGIRLVRGSTPIAIADADTGFEGTIAQSLGDDFTTDTMPIIHLDSPSTTSSTTYKIQYYLESAAVIPFYLNRSNNRNANTWNSVSSFTVMEIAA